MQFLQHTCTNANAQQASIVTQRTMEVDEMTLTGNQPKNITSCDWQNRRRLVTSNKHKATQSSFLRFIID